MKRIYQLYSIVCLIALVFQSSAACAEQAVNKYCPVMPGNPATSDHSLQFKGKRIEFCSGICRETFLESPDSYMQNVASLQQITWRDHVSGFWQQWWMFLVGGLLLLLVVVMRVIRYLRPGPQIDLGSRAGLLGTRTISPVVPLAILCCILGYFVFTLQKELHWKMVAEDIHFATFYDYSYPPVPKKPPLPKQISATYYRGNDERSERLYNGGNYRTATFHLSICRADGTKLAVGDSVDNEKLFVCFEIDRPSHTPDIKYADKIMKSTYLTREYGYHLGVERPVADRVDLEVREEMQKWRALYPLDPITPARDSKQGIIYVVEEYYYARYPWSQKKDSLGGGRFHYAIEYDLHFQGGRITAESDLWMGTLYRTRKFTKSQIPMDQWFSHQPIAELPHPNPDDPQLLGIEDYER